MTAWTWIFLTCTFLNNAGVLALEGLFLVCLYCDAHFLFHRLPDRTFI